MAKIFSLLLFCALCSLSSGLAQSLDEEASAFDFKIGVMRVSSVTGSFSGISGKVEFEPTDLKNSSFDFCSKAASINTGNKKRDDHLRSEDFFDVENHPDICFQSNKIYSKEEGYAVDGLLTMHGVTRQVTIPFVYADGVIEGKLNLDRRDFNIGPKSAFVIAKTVETEIRCKTR